MLSANIYAMLCNAKQCCKPLIGLWYFADCKPVPAHAINSPQTLNQRVQGSSPCAPTIDPARFFSSLH